MQVVIPMSGRGERFARAGHREIKPLVVVDGRPMIEHVIAMFPGATDLVLVCAADHLETTPLRAVLERAAPHARIVAIAPHKLGPVHAALAARDHIRDDAPVVLSYCDFVQDWDFPRFARTVLELGCAGCITAYRGFHPHSLGPTRYAYLRVEGRRMLEIREKEPFTADPMSEWTSAGAYYFASGALLKRTFDRAVAGGLATRGEYYASTPYNLLVADGLAVHVHEVEHFLQWGTPEDLAEYQGWSDHFAGDGESFPPRAAPHAGTNLVTMAGRGERFARAGWTRPKPLVPVGGTTMVERALASLPPARRWLALCRADDAADPEVRDALARGAPGARIEAIGPTDGQAVSCGLARGLVDPDAPLLVAPCDTALVYDEDRLAALTADPTVDAVVLTFRDHAPANRAPAAYGWVRADERGRVLGVSCKVALHDDVRRDPGVTGIFWVRRAALLFAAIDALVAADRRVRGELYLDSAFDVMVEQGRDVRILDVARYLCFGTPEEVATYEYWRRYFARRPRGHAVGGGE
jgi:NDP-sugar pyrophosphorylase family protein